MTIESSSMMKTRQEALDYGLSFPDTYQDAPFHDENWQLVRVRKNKKVFLWTYVKDGKVCINIKVNPKWRDLWRSTYPSVLPGYHQNKEHWNTVILDGSVPEEEIKRMIAESYDLVIGSGADTGKCNNATYILENDEIIDINVYKEGKNEIKSIFF